MAMQSLNGSTPGARAQLSQYQTQLQQARREAAQAANRVSQLEQQAAVARQESASADDKVRGLENQPPRSDSNNGGTRKRINTLSQLSGTLLDTTA